MDRAWLESRLGEGPSIESVARESGKPASTVAYWVNKHGLISAHAARHAAKGGIERDVLGGLVEQGLSVRQIAAESGLSAGTVQHWLRQYGLRTQPARYRRRDAPPSSGLVRECPRHGWTAYVRSSTGTHRCTRCRIEAVSTRRRRVKEILVAEAGGCCVICGFDGYVGALQFHHVDPAEKRFALASRGLARAMEEVRAEAAKCILLCANCHAAVEGGAATIPADRPADNS